jgi:hypothetical protein
MCGGWAFLEAFYRAGSRWQVGFDGANFCGAEEQAAIKWEKSMGLRKRGDEKIGWNLVRKGGDERSCGESGKDFQQLCGKEKRWLFDHKVWRRGDGETALLRTW